MGRANRGVNLDAPKRLCPPPVLAARLLFGWRLWSVRWTPGPCHGVALL